jgi:hypothetical protein
MAKWLLILPIGFLVLVSSACSNLGVHQQQQVIITPHYYYNPAPTYIIPPHSFVYPSPHSHPFAPFPPYR